MPVAAASKRTAQKAVVFFMSLMLQLKVSFKSRDTDENRRRCSADGMPNLGHPILREDWSAAAGRARQWPEAVRVIRTRPDGGDCLRPASGLFAKADPPALHRLRSSHRRRPPLARNAGHEARRD